MFTEWFPPDISPCYVGWYERFRYQLCPERAYWNGKRWTLVITGIITTPAQYRPDKFWRGFARPTDGTSIRDHFR